MKIKNKIKKLLFQRDSYTLAIRNLPQASILNDINTKFSVINNPVGYWLADPFLFEYNEKIYIFAEMFDCKHWKGVIGYAEYDNCKKMKWNIIISEPYHLSYPNIFSLNGEICIIPEAYQSNKLLLYKAVDFPNKWEKIELISNVKYCDTTLFEYNDCYIGFSQEFMILKPIIMKFDKNLKFIEYLDFKGKDDYFVTRPGGKFIEYKGKTIAVCQDCKQFYGNGLFFYNSEIDDNKIDLKETILHITPNDIKLNTNKKYDGLHTYNATDKYEIIDLLSINHIYVIKTIKHIFSLINTRIFKKIFKG